MNGPPRVRRRAARHASTGFLKSITWLFSAHSRAAAARLWAEGNNPVMDGAAEPPALSPVAVATARQRFRPRDGGVCGVDSDGRQAAMPTKNANPSSLDAQSVPCGRCGGGSVALSSTAAAISWRRRSPGPPPWHSRLLCHAKPVVVVSARSCV